MSSVIDSTKIDNTNVQKYHFKVIGSDLSKAEPKNTQPQNVTNEEIAKEVENSHESPIAEVPTVKIEQEPEKKDDQQSTFVEELMKKTDELTSSVIKMQMQMEAQQADFEQRLLAETNRAKEEGYEDGLGKANENFNNEIETLRAKFTSSISKIEQLEKQFEQKLDDIEHNLSTVAIDIAKEVLNVEVQSQSSQIALSLAKSLMEQIKEATHVEIKVSMDDFEYVSGAFKDSKNLEVIADDAIAKGGVILLSDIGNIDGDLDVRLQKVKELILDHKE
jgi:flagellar assembly protein FliH